MAVLVIRAVRKPQIDSLAQSPHGVTMGIPAFEQAGVPNQRIAYSHPFHPEDIQWVIGNADPTIQILEALPDDWRYPDPEE